MMTADFITETVNTLINRYSGQVVDYLGGHSGDGLAVLQQYIDLLAGETVAPNSEEHTAAAYYRDFPAPLDQYFSREEFQDGKVYDKGSIIIWDNDHPAIVVSSSQADSFEVFEQNDDPPSSPAHLATRLIHTAVRNPLGVLIPIKNDLPIKQPAITMDIRKVTGARYAAPRNDKVQLHTVVKAYGSHLHAASDERALTTYNPGKYYVFRRALNGMMNISKDYNQPGYWINPHDNVPPKPKEPEKPKLVFAPWPEDPEPILPDTMFDWRCSYVPMNEDRTPEVYVARESFRAEDLADSGLPVNVFKDHEYWIFGTFEKDNILYGRTHLTEDKDDPKWWYGIDLRKLDHEVVIYNTVTTLADRRALGIRYWSDYPVILHAYLSRISGKILLKNKRKG